MGLKSKLNRMKGHLQLEKESNAINLNEKDRLVENNPQKSSEEITLEEKWRQLGFFPYAYEDQVSYQKRTFYPFQKEVETEIVNVYDWWQKTEKDHPLSCKGVPLNRLMFFDTETTGLSTGVGNTIFLIGYARMIDNGIEVIQHVLGDPSDEVPFMYGFLEDFHEEDYLVSYNGKSFDWPHVKSRHAFVRNRVPKLPQFGHIDLLHAARRLWKHELPSCRLSIVEKEKLSIFRKNDTPGSMAPLLYFDYIQEKEPDYLAGIIDHNDQDVRSLVSLYVQLSKRLAFMDRKLMKLSPKESIQIGHWFEQLKWIDHAKEHYKMAIESTGNHRDEAYYKLAILLKKEGQINSAMDYFQKCISISSFPKPEVFIEMAKIAEHQLKDFREAYTFSCHALDQIKKKSRLTAKDANQKNGVEKRIERLMNKL
ncbi:ribonuclease H-like domain-containing protein [Evansella sp. AB-P1]|uniref:ribonuclease H-like domain-containing protein n=1 Tax=Evansella sp. AB-P1 TaxID=3037653 RepID=UPI00241F1DF9|nr:ribonuclease H-like domain-containing protein [Evansella sp. AB-P1]MDG5788484.1 ribonuclease H-like domain-containing protein [Evansella sp. AB-P1]